MHVIYTSKINIYKYILVFKNADLKIKQKYDAGEKFKIFFYYKSINFRIIKV